MDGLKVLYPPLPPPAAAEAEAEECARRPHRGLSPRPARRGRVRSREEEGAPAVKEEAEEVKIRAVEWWPVVKAEQEEEVKIRALERVGNGDAGAAAAGGGKRRRGLPVNREQARAVEAGPSGCRGAQPGNGTRGSSRFHGVTKKKGAKAKPWMAQIYVTEDGKRRSIAIALFAREEDAARAYDRVSIANSGHAKAKTNFPVTDYREEWAELEALGVDGAVALMREHAVAERQDVMDKASRFRGVSKEKGAKAKPWMAQIWVTEDGKHSRIHIGNFAREDDAARAYDRVSIAKLGHAKAKTNFPVAEYQSEWGQLEALGVDGAAALMREHAAAERPEAMNKASRFRGVRKINRRKTKPWKAEIGVTEDGKRRYFHIGTFAREEDAARAYDRVSIAKLGHAEAETNFAVAEYQEEWAELEALGVDTAAAREKQRAKRLEA